MKEYAFHWLYPKSIVQRRFRMAMSLAMAPRAAPCVAFASPSAAAASKKKGNAAQGKVVRRRPMEEIYGIRLERGVSKERLEQLRVDKWSKWESGDCWYSWNWEVDEWVYIVSGSLIIHPRRSELSGQYNAGDLVRFPKWFDAYLTFRGPYEQKYKFVAYGDTELD